jgi:hypothetical protein
MSRYEIRTEDADSTAEGVAIFEIWDTETGTVAKNDSGYAERYNHRPSAEEMLEYLNANPERQSEMLAETRTSYDERGQKLIEEVHNAAADYAAAVSAADQAMEKRDDAVRAAVAYGHKRTHVADAAKISRERLYQIL